MEAKTPLVFCSDLPPLIIPGSDGQRRLETFDTLGLDFSTSFRDCGFNDPGPKTEGVVALFYALTCGAKVCDAFDSFGVPLPAIAYTPQQLGGLAETNRALLRKIGRSAFFLLKRNDGEAVKVIGGILIPHKSGYLAVRTYHLDSVYVVRAEDDYLFIAP